MEISNGAYESTAIKSQFQAGVNYKHYYPFILKSRFYLKGGVEYMQMDYKTSDGTLSGFAFKGNNLSAFLALGNEWRWDSWSLGIEWSKVLVPITWQVTEESTASGTDFEKNSLANEEQVYLKQVNNDILRLYFGYSF